MVDRCNEQQPDQQVGWSPEVVNVKVDSINNLDIWFFFLAKVVQSQWELNRSVASGSLSRLAG